MRVLENKQKVKELGIKTLADGLNMGIVKEKVNAGDELEFDGEYVPGQDSCEEEDEEIDAKKETRKKQVLKMKEKKVKKVTNPVRRPITRSRAVGPSSSQV